MAHTIRRGRKAAILGGLATCALAFALSACSDDDNGGGSLTCGLDTGNSEINGTLSVAYSATLEGAGTVTSITYTTDTGPTTVNNPSMPFQANVTLATLPARIQASGSVTTGTITVQYSATGAPDRAEQDQASCSQTNN